MCGTGSRAWRRPRRPTPTSAPTSRRPPPPRRRSSARRRSAGPSAARHFRPIRPRVGAWVAPIGLRGGLQTEAGFGGAGRGGGRGGRLLLSIRVCWTAALSPDPTPLPQPHPAKEEDTTERTGWQAGGRGGAVSFGGWWWEIAREGHVIPPPCLQPETDPRLAIADSSPPVKADERIFGCV